MLEASVQHLLQKVKDLEGRMKGMKMDAINNKGTVMDGTIHMPCEIMHLNVGGTELFASRQTLTTIESSNLEVLFRGDMDGNLVRDEEGRVFMDVDPCLFQKIIEYLQAVQIANDMINGHDNTPAVPSVDLGDHETFTKYLDFFGVKDQDSSDSRSTVSKDQFLSYFTKTNESGESEHASDDSCDETDEYCFPDEKDDITNDHVMPSYCCTGQPRIANLYVNDCNSIISTKMSTLCFDSTSTLAANFNNDEWVKSRRIKPNASSPPNLLLLVDYPERAFRIIINQLRLCAMFGSGLSDDTGATSIQLEDEFEKRSLQDLLAHLFPSSQKNLIKVNHVEIDTTIIEDLSHKNKIKEWLASVNKTSTPRLLFRASRNGWTAPDFHQCCDNKGPTLTVVKSSSGYVFGGYSDQSWTSPSSGTWSASSSAFLFSLKCAAGLDPVQMKVASSKSNQANSVYNGKDYCPIFGNGHHFRISHNSNLDSSSYSNFAAGSYPLPAGVTDPYFLAGARSFCVAEYEVFGF